MEVSFLTFKARECLFITDGSNLPRIGEKIQLAAYGQYTVKDIIRDYSHLNGAAPRHFICKTVSVIIDNC